MSGIMLFWRGSALGLALVTFAWSPLVIAGDRPVLTQRDQHGRAQERWEPGPAQTYIRRDERGRRLGTVEPTPYGDYVIRDSRGRRTGSIEKRRY